MLLEQPLHRVEPLVDPLGVVEPVDADAERVVGGRPSRVAHRGAALGRPGAPLAPRRVGHSIEIG